MTQADVVAAVLDILTDAGIAHMIVGSFASSYHGVPRMTQDADIVIDVDETTVLGIVRRLESDFYVSEEAAREAVRIRRMFNVIHLASGFKVDLIVKKDRAFSDEELRRRREGVLAARPVSFATAEDTILTKLEWAKLGESQRQYDDAMGIIDVQSENLDWGYLNRWADELELGDMLARAKAREDFR